jgi:flagellar basal body P-ring formation protein FlgA
MDDPMLSRLPVARTLALALALASPLALGTAVAGPTGAIDTASGTAAASAIDALQPGLARQVKQLALDGSRAAPAGVKRIEVSLGQLDPRLRLAPCLRVEAYLPAGSVLWGKSRIGLRCTQGATAWNVFLPITVSAFGKAWVAAAPLQAGAALAAGDLIQAEVNLAEEAGMPVTDTGLALGRSLARALNAGQALRQTDLKARQWFSAGDEVKVSARGSGFNVAGNGQALNHGLEGQPVRVRVESGRVLVGMPVGERLVELPL